jgi:5'-nucleotidase
MRILLCNDDGIHAPGFKVLQRIARKLSDDIWIVAPESEQSAASHALTLHVPLRLRKISTRRYAVNGTPTDCIFLAFNKVLKGEPPDLVLSGVNRGENMGEDVTYSGTVAAAMEATLLGVPAIALSQSYERNRGRVSWKTAEHWAPTVVQKLLKAGWPRDVLINVNFPDYPPKEVAGLEVAAQGRHKMGDLLEERIDLRGNPYYWLRDIREDISGKPGSDLDAINRGAIAVTPLHLDLTHRPTVKKLRETLR